MQRTEREEMREQRDCWVCERCGFVWVVRGTKTPDQCPSRLCRSRKWNASGKVQEPVKELEPIEKQVEIQITVSCGDRIAR